MHILLIEDQNEQEPFVRSLLKVSKFNFTRANTAADALALVAAYDFDMVVISELSGQRGLISQMRNHRIKTPIVVLAPQIDMADLSACFQTGADEYLAMPMSLEEAVARLTVIARRFHGTYSSVIQVGELEVDVLSKEARCAGEPLQLTPREYEILEILALRRGKVVDRETLLDHLYSAETEPSGRVIDVFILRLRRKIDALVTRPATYLSTIRGQGYVLDAGFAELRPEILLEGRAL